MKVIPFKRLIGKGSPNTFYAVTGAKDNNEAIMAVIRYKKASKKTFADYFCAEGVIAPYKDENGKKWDGLYMNESVKGKKCLIVSR